MVQEKLCVQARKTKLYKQNNPTQCAEAQGVFNATIR
jgi:hypothetical protein